MRARTPAALVNAAAESTPALRHAELDLGVLLVWADLSRRGLLIRLGEVVPGLSRQRISRLASVCPRWRRYSCRRGQVRRRSPAPWCSPAPGPTSARKRRTRARDRAKHETPSARVEYRREQGVSHRPSTSHLLRTVALSAIWIWPATGTDTLPGRSPRSPSRVFPPAFPRAGARDRRSPTPLRRGGRNRFRSTTGIRP